jgi:hypothetical protein
VFGCQLAKHVTAVREKARFANNCNVHGPQILFGHSNEEISGCKLLITLQSTIYRYSGTQRGYQTRVTSINELAVKVKELQFAKAIRDVLLNKSIGFARDPLLIKIDWLSNL